MEADDIVVKQRLHELAMTRQRENEFARRPGDMQEEADRILDASFAHFAA